MTEAMQTIPETVATDLFITDEMARFKNVTVNPTDDDKVAFAHIILKRNAICAQNLLESELGEAHPTAKPNGRAAAPREGTKRRGRPKGSKNRPKPSEVADEPTADSPEAA
jgi:hypothetical protein